MSGGGAESSRFTHLLQPIRDLSKNWNIDLAQELEEYLDELEHLNIAFDPQDDAAVPRSGVAASTRLAQASLSASQGDGARVMNFAEAALLIQGTSVIYSRKVEYLYALVFQTLAHLTKQSDAPPRSNSHNSASAGDTGDAVAHDDDGDGDSYDVFRNPLPMVDDLDEARNITLKSNSIEAQRQRHAAKSNTNIQASISLMGSLIPDERDHGETFKLLSCTLHPSGVLLLDETSKKYLGDDARRGDSDTDAQWNGQRVAATQQSDPVAALNFDDVADDFFMDGGGGNDADDGDAGGPDDNYGDVDYGYGGGDDDDAGGAPADAPDDGSGSAPAASREEGDVGRHVSSSTAGDGARARRRDEYDPWAPLDPYDASAATSRPFRKGRSYPKPKKQTSKKKQKSGAEDDDDKQADGLDDPQFKERFLYGAARPQWTSWVWSETNDRALERKFQKKFCKAPLLVKSCDELWKLETKWRSLVRRRAVKDEQSAQAMLLQEQAEEEEAQMHTLGGIAMANGVSALDLDLNAAHDDDDDDDGGAPDEDYDDSGGAAFDTGDWDAHGDGDDSGVPMSSQYFDAALPLGKDGASSSGGPMSYEDICRQHIQSFMQGTEKYVRETNLSKQVNDWQSKLAPILKEQDAHPPFDIHTYGRDILGHLAHETKVKAEETPTPKRKAAAIAPDNDDDVDSVAPVPFGEIVGGMSQYQVCRMFLASLQLANNGNVHLVHGHSAAEQSHVPFQMKLLSTSNVYESLQQQ